MRHLLARKLIVLAATVPACTPVAVAATEAGRVPGDSAMPAPAPFAPPAHAAGNAAGGQPHPFARVDIPRR